MPHGNYTNQGPSDAESYSPTLYGGGHQILHYDQDGNVNNNGIHQMLQPSDQAELGRYRGLGEAAANRQAYQIDFSKANANAAQGLQDRGQQQQALGMMQGAAQGNAPSRAAVMGNQAGGQSLEAAMASSAGAKQFGTRNAPGLAAAQAAAAQGQGQMQLGAQNQALAGRSHEMASAIGAYDQGAGQVRQGDYAGQQMSQQQAELQGESEMAQRKLNQNAQIGYEQMGINTQQAQGDAAARMQHINNLANQAAAAAADATRARGMRVYTGVANAIGSLAGDSSLGSQTSGGGDDPNNTSDSDARAKQSIASLYEAPGTERHWDRDVTAGGATDGASLSGPTPKYSSFAAATVAGQKARSSPKERKPSDEELMRMAKEMQAHTASQRDGLIGRGTEVQDAKARDAMGPALEQMQPYQYEYKPGFRQSEGQRPGETNVGPMAQDMAKNPITGSAVQERPDGLLQIDLKKATKLNLGAVGYLARRQREQDEEIARLKGEA